MEYIAVHFLKGISEHVAGIVELDMILNALSPKLQAGEFFFCKVPGSISEYGHIDPLTTVRQSEGVKRALPVKAAGMIGLSVDKQVWGEYVGHHMVSSLVISRAGTGIPACII